MNWLREWRLRRRGRKLARRYKREGHPYPYLRAFIETHGLR